MDTFEEDVLAVQIETIRGPIIILTAYQPPRYPYLPKDLLHFMRKPIPVYFRRSECYSYKFWRILANKKGF